ncbi:MAG: glutathione S-transferase family protein [Rhodobiaceae bacterium]|nr:glutathione S-transferase family protein [Rhodobiaceae bacterium]
MKLYSGPLSMFGAKAEIACHEKSIEFELEFVPFSLSDLYSPKHVVVERVNPKAQVPVLVDGKLEIFDSTQIFEYLEDVYPEPPLWPRNEVQRARARLAELKSDEVFFPNVVCLMPAGAKRVGPEGVAAARRAIQTLYTDLEDSLTTDYLVGDFSYADIAFYMASYFAGFLGEAIPEACPRLIEWQGRVRARSAVRRVVEPMTAFLGSHGIEAA